MNEVQFIDGNLLFRDKATQDFELFAPISLNIFQQGSSDEYCRVELTDQKTVKCVTRQVFIHNIGTILIQTDAFGAITNVNYAPHTRSYCYCCFGDNFLQTNHIRH